MANFTYEPRRSSLTPRALADYERGKALQDNPMVTIPLSEYRRLVKAEIMIQHIANTTQGLITTQKETEE